MTREFKQSRVIQKRLLPKKLTSDRIKVDQHNLSVAPRVSATFPPIVKGKAIKFLPESKDASWTSDA